MNFGAAMRTSSWRVLAVVIAYTTVLAATITLSRAATPDQAPPVAPSQTRVWFLRQLLPGTPMYAPMIYANGAPVAISSQGTAFYRDFAPGTYEFSVENCLPMPQTSQTLPLSPGDQIALQVQSNENGVPDCEPSEIYYISLAPAEQLSDLFAPLAYLGSK